jgi:glycosyltransferase involved in cell wall biosynthesis
MRKSLRILVISNLYPPYVLGGYEILCEQVCSQLNRKGHVVSVLTSNHGEEGDTGAGEKIKIERTLKLYLPFELPPMLLREKRKVTGKENYEITKRMISKEKPDIVFFWSLLRLTIGPARAAQDSGLPVVYTFNDEHISGFLPGPLSVKPKAFIRYLLDKFIYADITLQDIDLAHTTCISRQLKNNLIASGVPIEKSEVIYQGIPIEKFPVKEESGKLHSPIRIAYVGQLHPYKGVHTLIEAIRIISYENRVNVRLTIVGEGAENYKREIKLKAESLNDRVAFKGKMAHGELPAYYRESDIFVFPSIWQEPFGLTHLESMASGTPVISTNDGGHGEFLEDCVNALVFKKEDAGMLSQCIMRLIGDHDLRRLIANNARKMVEERFTVTRYVDDIEAMLERVISV